MGRFKELDILAKNSKRWGPAEQIPGIAYPIGFDLALIGHTLLHHGAQVPVYDYHKCVAILRERDGMMYTEAVEWMEFNVVLHTPEFLAAVFIQTSEEEEE
jgi:hypothetical protein